MSRHPTPAREGHWWAKLKLAENPDDNSVNWEVVQVFDNNGEGEEAFMASVPGIERGQRLDAFVWGPPVHMPAELARPDGASSRHTQTETATGSEQEILSLTKEVERLKASLFLISQQRPEKSNSADPDHENYLRNVLIDIADRALSTSGRAAG